MASPSIKQVAAAALASIERVLSCWLPDGVRRGHEYVVRNPTRSDSTPGSFSINLNTGAWADFASNDRGGDLVALIAYLEQISQGAAAKRLVEFLGMSTEKSDSPQRAASDSKSASDATTSTKANKPAWRALLPVPGDAPQPYASHPKHGKPSMRWAYREADGGLLCWVYRFEPKSESERKQFFPLTYCEDESGKRMWRWQGLPDPRPLYNLDKLTANPSAPVVVVEGEKSAVAAALLFPDSVCITMLNGAQSPHKTDWKPLAGRAVCLWADNDEAGQACMAKVAMLAREAGAAGVWLFNLSAFACVPGTGEDGAPILTGARPLPEKWDAADAVADGWTAEHVALLMQLPDFLQDVPVDVSAPVANAQPADAPRNAVADIASDKQLSRFECGDRGVWYYDGGDDKWWWVCSKLEITAFTRDAKNESWGRLLEFHDMDGTHHAWAMPMELLSGDGNEYRRMLLSMGLQIAASSKARNLLTQYIQTAKVEQRARCVERTGWHGGVFVMPDRTIGASEERVLYQTASATPGTFRQKGKLAEWQASVAALCVGNSRLLFSVSTAFAGPLLHVTGMEGGGVHLRGASSCGKTTGLRAATSVWGGVEYLQRWRATDNGLEALAAQHSDCLLVLDELGQVDPKAVGESAYLIANGGGKARANRNGGLRDPASWRILFLSSGEAGLAEHMSEAKKKSKAGQEIRLLDIPADAGAGCGMFENLHQYANGATFSKAINEAASKHYGTAAQPYLEKLVEHHDQVGEWIKTAQREFAHAHVDEGAGGQVHRAALRFALIGAAGELASKWEITGWDEDAAMQAAVICFRAWLAQRGGAGNLEELTMLAQVREFLERHGEGRFTDWHRPVSQDTHAPRVLNRAGFRKHDELAERVEYFIYPEVFRTEVCAGFDHKAVARLLMARGYLAGEKERTDAKKLLPGEGYRRMYHILPELWEDADA